jgi:hypothetical protein
MNGHHPPKVEVFIAWVEYPPSHGYAGFSFWKSPRSSLGYSKLGTLKSKLNVLPQHEAKLFRGTITWEEITT